MCDSYQSCGHNDNPTARQFKSAYNRLLGHVDIKISKNANAKEQSSCNILKMPSTRIQKLDPFSSINCVNSHLRNINIKVQNIMDDDIDDYIVMMKMKMIQEFIMMTYA